jgi:hypothetical protein
VTYLSLFRILTYRTFEPTEISGLQVWLDNETLGANGSAISTWLDSSGNGNHFIQPDATYQPTVFIDGSRKTMRTQANSFLLCPTGLSILNNVSGATIYIAYDPDQNGNTLVHVSDGVNTYLNPRMATNNLGVYFASRMKPLDGGTSYQVLSNQTVDLSAYVIQGTSADFSNLDLYQYINSFLDKQFVQSGGTNTSNTDSAGIFLGGRVLAPHGVFYPSTSSYPYSPDLSQVKILEVLIFDKVLSALEKFNVERYLSIKHGITLSQLVPSSGLLPATDLFLPW